jgi:hypothetical protein
MALDTASVDTAYFAAPDRLLELRVRMPDGGVLGLAATAGTTVADMLIEYGIPISRPRFRAGLLMTPELDGTELQLDWSALEPQTHWVAG